MIRFVDVRCQGLMARFSFWNTVTDRYLEFSGEQAWDTWDHFMEAFDDGTYNLPRLKSKCPEWVFKEPTNEELDFREEQDEDQ